MNRRSRRSLRDLTGTERQLVAARSGGWCCYWCGVDDSDGALTLEHLRPLSQGGDEHVHNYALACERCNKSRGNHPRPKRRGRPRPRRGL
jgi:5-methylcytosine-specific restriction endonuclease McrA